MTQGYSITDLDFLNREQGWATTTKLDTSQTGPLLETHNGAAVGGDSIPPASRRPDARGHEGFRELIGS